ARLDFEFLFDDPWVVAAGAQSPWARKRRVVLADLASEPWVVQMSAPGSEIPSMTTSITMEAFRARGLEYPRTTIVADTGLVRMQLLASGRFLTIFGASTLRFSTLSHEFKVLPIVLPVPHLPYGITTQKNRTLSPVARLFIEHAREVAKPLSMRKS